MIICMKNFVRKSLVFLVVVVVGCAPLIASNETNVQAQTPTQEVTNMSNFIIADVLSVEAAGQTGSYQFNVQVSSPDSGCDQYAD